MYTIVSIEKINHIFLSGAPDNYFLKKNFFFILVIFFPFSSCLFFFCYQSIVYDTVPPLENTIFIEIYTWKVIVCYYINSLFFLIISYSLSYTLFFTNISLIIGNRHITRLLYSYNFRVCSPFLIFGLNIE